GFPGCRLPGLSAALRHACAIIRHNRTTFHHLLRPLALPGVAIVVVAVSVAKAAPAIRRSPGLRGIIVDDSPALRHAAVAIRHNRTTVIFYGTPVILRWQGTGDGLGTSTSVVLAPIESVVALSTSVVKAPDASVVRLHHSAYIGSLIVERRQVRRRCAVREEPAIVSRRNTRSRCATRVQALPRGDHRQVGSHHAALAHLSGIHAKAPVVHGIVAKVLSGDGSYRSAHASIGQDQVGVGESSLSSAAQWRYHVGPVDHVDMGEVECGDVYHVYAVEAATVPGIEIIMRAAGEPADGTEAASVTEADEHYESRRPHGPIIRTIDWSGPPNPGAAPNEPAAVVIRRPAPGLIRNPSPSPVGIPHPAADLIRRPGGLLIWLPDVAVTWHINPAAVGIQVMGACVIRIGLPPSVGVLDQVVAVLVPAIPIGARRRFGNLVLRIVHAADGDHLALFHPGAALRRSHFGLAVAHDHVGFHVGKHFHQIPPVPRGMHCHVRRIDLYIGFAALEHAVVHVALRNLYLDTRPRQVGDLYLALRGKTQNVGVVQLELLPVFLVLGQLLAPAQGVIERGPRPIAAVAALRRNVTVDHADASHIHRLAPA